ncbi:glycosyltransferase family A protein [Streptomyces sp. NPDC050617]|uniref:glycosyltransferase family 2 protein n=1 Tax=Streptomyces sp. NPDC050617 TaxID=3154628 RepID=UPI0034155E0C
MPDVSHQVEPARGPALPPARLTVLIPHRDCPRFLPQAVSSVLGQTARDLAVVVLDDCSADGSWRRALAPFATDRRLTVLASARPAGPFRLGNAVLPLVRSPYVAFQDADDISHPLRLERQLRLLERGRADVVGCCFEVLDEAGTPLYRKRLPRHADVWMRLGRSFAVLHGATAMRRGVLDRLGGFDGTTRFGADTDFHLRAARLFRVRNLPSVLYRQRRWPRSLTAAPDTGFGSAARAAYARVVRDRERERRAAASWEELAPLLTAAPNDVRVELRPVRLEGAR